MILSCFRCRDNTGPGAKFQDEKYGTGMRVHNETASRVGTSRQYRCTICENTRSASGK